MYCMVFIGEILDDVSMISYCKGIDFVTYRSSITRSIVFIIRYTQYSVISTQISRYEASSIGVRYFM